jgi:hypothetical protein
MSPTAADPHDDAERAPAQAFQSESGEHQRSAPRVMRSDSGPAAAYQHEDGEPVAPIASPVRRRRAAPVALERDEQ